MKYTSVREKKRYPEELTGIGSDPESYRLWADAIRSEIWDTVRSVIGIELHSDAQLKREWEEVKNLLLKACDKAEYLACQDYVINENKRRLK